MTPIQACPSWIKNAIVGGDILSLYLCDAFSEHQRIDCIVYEAADALTADGAAVGSGKNVQVALKLLRERNTRLSWMLKSWL